MVTWGKETLVHVSQYCGIVHENLHQIQPVLLIKLSSGTKSLEFILSLSRNSYFLLLHISDAFSKKLFQFCLALFRFYNFQRPLSTTTRASNLRQLYLVALF